ncbi:MAG: fdxN element excision recombinase XisF, partial [Cyanobacteria bacterium P01_A01_bin.105]
MSGLPPVVGYCRVSSREQSENSAALGQQIARVEAAGAEAVLTDVESGRAGHEGDRYEFGRLMRLVEQRLVEKVIVTRLDRLSRSLPTLRKTLDTFQKAEVALVALDDSIDMSTAAGKFHINIMGAMAEMESDHLSERIRRGKEHFRKQKRASHPPFGYKVRDYRHEVDREPFLCLLETQQALSKADMSRDLIEGYIRLESLAGTCRWFVEKYGYQEFWTTAFKRWLTSPVLRGHLVYFPKSPNPEIHHNQHEAILTEEEYQDIRQILEFNRRVGGFGRSRGRYALTGLVKCDCCGGGCVISNGLGGKYKYFACVRARYKACECNRWVRMELLEQAVIDALVERAADIAKLADVSPNQEPAELAELRSQLAVLEQLSDNPAIVEARADLKRQIEALTYRRESRTQIDSGLQELLSMVASQPDFWAGLPTPQKQKFLRALVEKVV